MHSLKMDAIPNSAGCIHGINPACHSLPFALRHRGCRSLRAEVLLGIPPQLGKAVNLARALILRETPGAAKSEGQREKEQVFTTHRFLQ